MGETSLGCKHKIASLRGIPHGEVKLPSMKLYMQLAQRDKLCYIWAGENVKLYTGEGDQGLTDTLSGNKIEKSDIRVHLLGTIDEFTSTLGLAKSLIEDQLVRKDLVDVQYKLISLNAEIAGGKAFDAGQAIKEAEESIDRYQQEIGEFKGFVLPGDFPSAAALDVARTVVRRAERVAVELKQKQGINEQLLVYLNRLSDIMYAIARYLDYKEKVKVIVKRVVDRLNETVGDPEVKDKLTLKSAKALAAEIEQKAQEMGLKVVVAVADEGGNLILLHRMDDAFIASIDIAINKAYTAVALKMTTETVGKLSQPGSPLYGLQFTNNNRLVIFGGGAPLKAEGKIVGGLGVSGGSAAQDIELVEYGTKVFERGS